MGAIISSPSGKITLRKQTHQTRHTNRGSIFMYKSKRRGHKWLQKINKSNAILKKQKSLTLTIEPGDEPNGGWTAHEQYTQIWEAIQEYTWQSEKDVHSFMQTITQYIKLNRSWTVGCWWQNGTSTMDQEFSSSTRAACTDNNNIPRQQNYYSRSKKINMGIIGYDS